MKALVAGSGSIAKVHCKILADLGVEIVGIYNRSIASAEELAKAYGAKAFDDYEKALAETVDFVVICTPSGTHPRLAIKAMEAGKHVVVEKPLGLNPEDCDAVLETAEKTGQICAPISQLRFSSVYHKVKGALEQNALGTLIMSSMSMKYFRDRAYYDSPWKGTKAMDGGQLMNQGFHGVDVMCGLLGVPTAVSGKVTTRYHHIEAEDTAVAHFTFPSGMVGTIDASTAIGYAKPRRFEICGRDGTIVMEEDMVVAAEGVPIEIDTEGEYKGSNDPKNIGYGLHTGNYKNILAAFRGEAPLAYTARDAANTAKVIWAVYESSAKNQIIFL